MITTWVLIISIATIGGAFTKGDLQIVQVAGLQSQRICIQEGEEAIKTLNRSLAQRASYACIPQYK